ncbi:MAG: helix-turn-helix domain-containing protein [Phycisphaeraceae bacterium]
MPKRMALTTEQRTEAVMSLLRREEPASAIARRYGISEPSLYRLRDQFLDGGKQAMAQASGRKTDAKEKELERLQQDVARRDRVIGELTIANRLLKKHSADLL